jgi:hypothetical protein
MAYAFAEFRLAAQRHRIDIKKPMDEAARAVANFVTGDALIQQLTKRRKRYLEDQAKEGSAAENPPSVLSAKKSTPVRFTRDHCNHPLSFLAEKAPGHSEDRGRRRR